MPQYRIRLESPQWPDQWREMSVAAPNELLARAIAMRAEQDLVNWSLTPAAPVKPEPPQVPNGDLERVDATVAMDYLAAHESYAAGVAKADSPDDEVEAAHERLKALQDDHGVDKRGKAYGPTKQGRGHVAIHMQTEPYRITAVEVVRPEIGLLVEKLKAVYLEDAATWDEVLKRMRDDGIPLGVVTGTLFGLPAQKLIDGSTSYVWTTATEKASLHTVTYAPAQDTHDFFNDVTNEITGTGYTAGGATIATPTTAYDTATDQVRLDGVDASWASSTLTARISVVWTDTAGASTTDPTWGWVDFGADVSTTNGTFSIAWDATGILNYDVS